MPPVSRGTRHRVLSMRMTGANVALTLSCGHTVIRKARDGGRPFAFCGHCAAEWADRMMRHIDGAQLHPKREADDRGSTGPRKRVLVPPG